MGDNDLVKEYTRRMPLPTTQQAVTDYKTFELSPKFEEALFKARDGRFWGYSTGTNPSCHLADYWVLVLCLVEADTFFQQCLAKGRDAGWERRRSG